MDGYFLSRASHFFPAGIRFATDNSTDSFQQFLVNFGKFKISSRTRRLDSKFAYIGANKPLISNN